MNNKIKVAIVLPSFIIGGAQRMVCELLRTIDYTRFDVLVICFQGHAYGSELEKAVEQTSAVIKYIGPYDRVNLVAYKAVFNIVNLFNPDVIHAHLGGMQMALPWVLLHRCPMLVTLHSTLPCAIKKKCEFLLRYASKKRLVTFVTVSDDNKKQARDYFSDDRIQLTSIDNGIVLNDYGNSVKSDYPVYINLSRQDDNKNQSMIIDAFFEVQKIYPGARLLLIGDGPTHESLINQASGSEGIEIPGEKNNVAEWLSKANVYVQSSYREGLPMSILEALATGLPVISTNVGGIHNVIKNDFNGILIKPGSTTEMRDAMLELADKSKCFQLGVRAKESSLLYSATNMTKKYEKLYISVSTQRRLS